LHKTLMLRTAIAVLMVLMLCSGAHAIGTVTFRNDVDFFTSDDRLVRDVSGMPLVGTNYLAQLYYGASDATESSLTPVTSPPARFRPATTDIPGTWAGGNRILSGFFPGDTVNLQVRVWDGTVGATYEEAYSVGFSGTQYGVSAPFAYAIPPLGGDPQSYIHNFRGFTLVPEPSLALLAIVGIVGLYFARRRRE
jgi:hypothetical protein